MGSFSSWGRGLLEACSQISPEGGVSGGPLWGTPESGGPGYAPAHVPVCAYICLRAGVLTPVHVGLVSLQAFLTLSRASLAFKSPDCPGIHHQLLGVCLSPARTEPSCPPPGGAWLTPPLSQRTVCSVHLWAGGSGYPLCGDARPWEGKGVPLERDSFIGLGVPFWEVKPPAI